MPFNTIINSVPQQSVYIVERFGKFHKQLKPGLAVVLPFVDKIRYVQSLKETAYSVPKQTAITADNVSLEIDGVLFTRVVDPYKASYNVNDVSNAVEQLAQTAMRSEIGYLTLDNVLRERTALNQHITQAINEAALDWGITCFRYEIKDIRPPQSVLQSMEKQITAERTKRAEILDSEGRRESAVNKAQGEKSSLILRAEAQAANLRMIAEGNKDSTILQAQGERDRILALAEADKAKVIAEAQADASRIMELANAIAVTPAGQEAVNLIVAEKYIAAFKEMAASSNTMVVPTDMSDMSGMVAGGMSMFGAISNASKSRTQQQEPPTKLNGSIRA